MLLVCFCFAETVFIIVAWAFAFFIERNTSWSLSTGLLLSLDSGIVIVLVAAVFFIFLMPIIIAGYDEGDDDKRYAVGTSAAIYSA